MPSDYSYLDTSGTGLYREAIEKERSLALSHNTKVFNKAAFASANPNSMTRVEKEETFEAVNTKVVGISTKLHSQNYQEVIIFHLVFNSPLLGR